MGSWVLDIEMQLDMILACDSNTLLDRTTDGSLLAIAGGGEYFDFPMPDD